MFSIFELEFRRCRTCGKWWEGDLWRDGVQGLSRERRSWRRCKPPEGLS